MKKASDVTIMYKQLDTGQFIQTNTIRYKYSNIFRPGNTEFGIHTLEFVLAFLVKSIG